MLEQDYNEQGAIHQWGAPKGENVPQPDVMFKFDGTWLPSVDPALIGPNNYQKLINMRYADSGIEGINGYTLINSNPITTYINIKNGIHFKVANRTQVNYVMAHATDSTASPAQGKVFYHKGDIGTSGVDFQGTELWTDTTTDLTGRFDIGPAGHVAYANGQESFIWEGEEGFIAGAFSTTTTGEANPVDCTEKLTNSRTAASEIITVDSTRRYVTILTTRPAKGFKVTVPTARGSAGTLEMYVWTGSSYTKLDPVTDSMVDNTNDLQTSGTITFNDPGTAKLKHFEERYLYAYQLRASATADSDVSEITADMAPQKPSNIWDGIYRTPIQCQVKQTAGNTYEDYTLHVAESSNVSVPVGAILDALDTDGEIIIMFDEPMAGIRVTMLGNLINSAGGVLTVNYWNGSAYADTSATDGTTVFGESGLIYWDPPSDEERKTLFGTQGYVYQLTTDTQVSGTVDTTEEVVIDLLTGVPKRTDIETYKFPLRYKNKLLMCGYTAGNEGNRIDYSEDNIPDVFNGENTSLDGYQSLYVGGSDNLTGGVQLYNRFGSNLFASLALFKENELYLLTGDSPLDYKIYPVSRTIGCPAPLSVATAEVGFEFGEDIARNVVLFISNAGPMMYDGATLQKLDGLDVFFDPNESLSVNFDKLDLSRGWFDATYKEYNILIPVGTSQDTLNYWLTYDLVRRKWFQKDTGTANKLQCGFPVVDTNGEAHVYGGDSSGNMYYLENGSSWNGADICNEIQTGDFFPSGNEWDITMIRRIKFAAKRIAETDAYLWFYYYGDTDFDGGVQVDFTDVPATLSNGGNAGLYFTDVTADMSNSGNAGVQWVGTSSALLSLTLDEGLNRLARTTVPLNKVGWCHSFGFKFYSNETNKGLQPIMWGVQWEFVRKDHSD